MLKRLNLSATRWKSPRVLVRIGLGALLAANLVAAAIVFKPWAGSAEDLDRQAASLRQQVRQKQLALDKLRTIVNKVQNARSDGDKFMEGYLLSKRTVSSSLLGELEQVARKAGIRQKDAAFAFEPVEGSDGLMKATITGAYEGTYADLIQFINQLDRSPRFLILEYLEAKPQQSGLALTVLIRLDAFVREGGPAPAVASDSAPEPAGGDEPRAAPAPAAQAAVNPPAEKPRAVPAAAPPALPARLAPAIVSPGGPVRQRKAAR